MAKKTQLLSANTDNLEKILGNSYEKQNKLIAGEYITLSVPDESNGNVTISAHLSAEKIGGLTSVTASGTAPLTLEATTVGTDVTITGSVDLSSKQDVLTAGTGISIEDNVIACTLDTTVFKIVESLPTSDIDENVIYVVPSDNTGENNTYVEYIYVNGAWEMIGKYIPTVDMSLYETKEDAQEALNELEEKISEEYETIEAANEAHDVLQNSINTEIENRTELIEETTDEEYVLKAVDASGSLLIGFKASGELEVPIGVTDDSYTLIYALYEKLKEVVDSVKVNNETIETLESNIKSLKETKQDTLSAGSGISIDDNIISTTIDTSAFETTEAANESHSALESSINAEVEARESLIAETDDTSVLKIQDANGNVLQNFLSDGTCDITSGIPNGTYEVLMAVYEKMNEIAQAIKELKN